MMSPGMPCLWDVHRRCCLFDTPRFTAGHPESEDAADLPWLGAMACRPAAALGGEVRLSGQFSLARPNDLPIGRYSTAAKHRHVKHPAGSYAQAQDLPAGGAEDKHMAPDRKSGSYSLAGFQMAYRLALGQREQTDHAERGADSKRLFGNLAERENIASIVLYMA